MTQTHLHFGPDVTPADAERLGTQLNAVRDLLSYGQWWTLEQIRQFLLLCGINATTQSISARLRDLRKKQFGAYTVERRRIGKGLFEYRVKP